MYKVKLTRRYIPALLLITLFTLLSHFVSENIIKSNSEYANIINISGKQRMLSQKLVILASNYLLHSKDKEQFLAALNEIETAHEYLKTKIYNDTLYKIYFKEDLDGDLKEYLNKFYIILNTKDNKYLISVMNSSNSVLKQLDKAVKAYEKHSNKELKKLRNYERFLLICALSVLLLEALFIFMPAAKQIEQSEELLKSYHHDYENVILEISNSAIIAIDWRGYITTYNKKAEEIFGWSKGEMIGFRHLSKIIPEEYKRKHTTKMANFLKHGGSSGTLNRTHELKGLRKNGEIFPIRLSIGGKWKTKHTIVIATIEDITKEIQQETILLEQSKNAAMGEMIGNIAHQWRQPLNVISTGATGLKLEKEYDTLTDESFIKNVIL
ncbi:MAG: PAS domain S-box protein [Campylobacterota bacterium]|nr:PAS domain S-box protein [Campylobacterota bacterium]